MRSREEQIKVLADDFANPPESYQMMEVAELHINEAIQRGRELERAEMGRDTARLDWIERHRATQAVHLDGSGWHVLAEGSDAGFSGNTFRIAIDAAMNAENGQ
ncbi:hypothetical protein AA11826_1686 [Komagataeibacter oboediens DSM 11826]|uniref:Uncharacterized protein n=1 Tax=Komagataeibacter oboediens TaxID=65958 RepID=A0A318R603_9PROT|nr:hypothetical protein [Komagataeibacter oboediens]PYD81603.1 hypothetical protein CFR80_10715 [Komagataeibacter oboediens]GBR37519.1 hypothetical protein AA11826_1686 [Komagataeibacter oboediens DSM 11826]